MKYLLIVGALSLLTFQSVSFATSNEGRGGGDGIALEFQQALLSAVQESRSHPELFKVLTDYKIVETAARAQIIVVDDALDIMIKDLVQNSVAVNIPTEQKILINRKRWRDIQDSHILSAIALHEVLSLKKLEQTGYYPYSTKYLSLVGGSPSVLESSLRVNRLMQLSIYGSSIDESLRKFFEEAREPVSILELPEYNKIDDRHFRCVAASPGVAVRPLKFGRINAPLRNADLEMGPLFPESRAWRITEENTLDQDSKFWSTRVSFNSSPTEFNQIYKGLDSKSFYSQITFRKNNGLLTFQAYWEKSVWKPTLWGYCFSPNKASKATPQ